MRGVGRRGTDPQLEAAADAPSGAHYFVVPPFESGLTGGNLYNASLLGALAEMEFCYERASVSEARRLLDADGAATFWFDTLYLDHVAPSRQASRRARIGLLCHYLPTLVRLGEVPAPEELSDVERSAVAAADAFMAPSHYMAMVLEKLGARDRPILVVEPGSVRDAPKSSRDTGSGVVAVLVANLVDGKGILPFLWELDRLLYPADLFRLEIVGGFEQDTTYAAACRNFVQGSAALRDRITFSGALPHAVMLERLAAANLFVSTSRMESFGMALAEARSAGVPIVARSGGNVRAHVDEQSGGRLCSCERDVAMECLLLSRNPVEHARRLQAARAGARVRHTWADAALSFVAKLRENRL